MEKETVKSRPRRLVNGAREPQGDVYRDRLFNEWLFRLQGFSLDD